MEVIRQSHRWECVTANYFSYFSTKNMLCALKTIVSMIWFFWAPKKRVQTDKNNRNFTLKLLNWPNLRALSYGSLLILTHKLHCTSKGDALKWPVLKNDSSSSIVWPLNNGWIFFGEHRFLKNMSFRITSRFSNSMDPDNAQHFNLNLPSVVDKVYQRNSFSRQILDAF